MLPLPPQNKEFRAVGKQEGKAGQQKTAPHVSQDTALCKADLGTENCSAATVRTTAARFDEAALPGIYHKV